MIPPPRLFLLLLTLVGHTICFQGTPKHAEVSPYYRRDRRDRSSLQDVDTIGLRRLLDRRYHARQSSNYTLVTETDQVLRREYQVRVYEHPPIWSRLLSRPPRAHLRRLAERRYLRPLRDQYGPRGHPYRRVGQEAVTIDIPIPTVHDMLSRRLLKNESEEIALELRLHGVRICDNYLQWTTDPSHEFVQEEICYSNETIVYSQDPNSLDFSEPEERWRNRVVQLVQQRSDALQRDDERRAKFIAFELFESYRVGVCDKRRTWSLGAVYPDFVPVRLRDFNPPDPPPFPPLVHDKLHDPYHSPTYQQSCKSKPLDERFADRVEALVLARVHRREEGRFLEADALRHELWHTYVSTETHRCRNTFSSHKLVTRTSA